MGIVSGNVGESRLSGSLGAAVFALGVAASMLRAQIVYQDQPLSSATVSARAAVNSCLNADSRTSAETHEISGSFSHSTFVEYPGAAGQPSRSWASLSVGGGMSGSSISASFDGTVFSGGGAWSVSQGSAAVHFAVTRRSVFELSSSGEAGAGVWAGNSALVRSSQVHNPFSNVTPGHYLFHASPANGNNYLHIAGSGSCRGVIEAVAGLSVNLSGFVQFGCNPPPALPATHSHASSGSFRILGVCPTPTSQPQGGSVCRDGTIQLAFGVDGSAIYQWRRNGVAITEGRSEDSTIFLGARSPVLTISHAGPLAAGEFDCLVTDAHGGLCGSFQSNAAVVSLGVTECPCPPELGVQPARWNIAHFTTGQFGQTPLTGETAHLFDCSKPTALILHGFVSGPDADWIGCLATETMGRFPAGVNVLIANSSFYMQPISAAAQGVIAGATLGGGLTGAPGAVVGAAIGGVAEGIFAARDDIPLAADDLARDLECFLGPCGASPGVEMIIGHSFGGGIGAEVGERLVAGTGRLIPTLVTIDTPWRVLPLTMDRQVAIARRYFGNHVNYYSPCRTNLDFGAPLSGGNTRNFNSYPGPSGPAGCILGHVCQAHSVCGLFTSPAAAPLFDGTLPPGAYLEGPTPYSVVPGAVADSCGQVPYVDWPESTPSTGDLAPGFSTGGGVVWNPPVLTIPVVPGGGGSSITVPLAECPGFLVFEYQLENIAPSQAAVIHWQGRLVWRAAVETPPGEWMTDAIDLRDGCVRPVRIDARLLPARRGETSPTGAFRLRHVRIVDPAVVRCAAPPVLASDTAAAVDCRGAVARFTVGPATLLGSAYQWRLGGVPIADGPAPGGGIVAGAHGPVLAIAPYAQADAGAYDCVVTNACGSTVSTPVTFDPPGCCAADYDGDGDIGTDSDIEAFFACLAGDCCATCFAGADFNGDGDIGTDADIESFFRVLAGGNC